MVNSGVEGENGIGTFGQLAILRLPALGSEHDSAGMEGPPAASHWLWA